LLVIGLDASLPSSYDDTLAGLLADVSLAVEGRSQVLSLTRDAAPAHLALAPLAEIPAEQRLAQRYYAIVAPFASLQDDVPLAEVQARWASSGTGALLATEDAVSDLAPILGAFQGETLRDWDLLARLQADPQALGVLPFDRLDPTYKVLTLDGVNVLSNHLTDGQYPLAVGLRLLGSAPAPLSTTLHARLAPLTNRDSERLTSLIMTGVTAMCRLTADRMETHGVLYPALMISDTLRAADITHVSNEVPFIKGCEVDRRADNLVFCSDYDYWGALEAIGTDIVGLSGNHVNDFGYDGARESIAFYRERGIPIYGSGLNLDEACAPIFVDDHGNRIAFLATLAWNPQSAWATDELPGTCYFYDHQERILQSIRDLRQQADIVAVELQYLETYNPFPTDQQVNEFRELRDAGATIVTGVQSHVPQSWEPYGQADPRGPGIIVYGLGNLFFDQMWSWETRTELIARHTLYDGRLISSEILTTVLEDFAQPRWATPQERAEILNRIHGAAPKR
jgi:poly-gamma-glutamate synthesis protein (capsule biosynthesis protein)